MKPGAADLPFEQRIDQRLKSGRALFGNRYRIVDDEGKELPHDGVAFGHFRVKAPWVSSAYFKGEGGSAVDEHGWLKTGDLATISPDGYISLTDRSKDVIKSGGEWISSIELENVASGHPAVLQAAAIGITHPKWQERPLLVVTRREGASLSEAELLDYMRGKVASWWLPDAVEFIDQMPLTGTGKLWKLKLREQFKDYRLEG
jgi:fatty-acyl-CoA synthase